jgi:predicted transcriptional regulator
MSSVTTSVRIEQKLAQRLERAAARLSRGKSWIVSKALEEYLVKFNQMIHRRSTPAIIPRPARSAQADHFGNEDNLTEMKRGDVVLCARRVWQTAPGCGGAVQPVQPDACEHNHCPLSKDLVEAQFFR